MDGMLLALEPKWREEASCPMLSAKVKNLMERKVAEKEGRCPRLAKRLAGLSRPVLSKAEGAESRGLTAGVQEG